MICNTCTIKPICKIYDAHLEYAHIAEITIKDCRSYSPLSSEKKEEPQKVFVSPERITAEDRISIIEQASLSEVKMDTIHVCADCEEEYEHELRQCSSCKKDLCEHCTVSYEGNKICESCYFDKIDGQDVDVNPQN